MRSAQVGDIKVALPMSYRVKDAGVGVIGAVPESAARSSPPDEAALLERAIGLLKAVVENKLVTAASQRSGIEFVAGQQGSEAAARRAAAPRRVCLRQYGTFLDIESISWLRKPAKKEW